MTRLGLVRKALSNPAIAELYATHPAESFTDQNVSEGGSARVVALSIINAGYQNGVLTREEVAEEFRRLHYPVPNPAG